MKSQLMHLKILLLHTLFYTSARTVLKIRLIQLMVKAICRMKITQ